MKTLLIAIVFCVLSLLSILPAEALAQTGLPAGQAGSQSPDTTKEGAMTVIRSLHDKFGTGRIMLKDRGIIKNVKIYEIHPYWIVYIKNGSLHDLMIEKIQRIEIGKEKQRTIYFDNNKLIIY